MPVFSFVTSKGGAGKSTLTITTASVLAKHGKTVFILDADPNGHVQFWRERCQTPVKGITVEHTFNEDRMDARIAEVRSQYDYVLIDAEGAASRSQVLAAALADLVVIPSMPSMGDIAEAAKTVRMMKRAMGKAQVPYVAVFTKTPNFMNAVWKDAIAACDEHVGNRLPQTLPDRTLFQQPMTYGGTIYDALDEAGAADRKKYERHIQDAENLVADLTRHYNESIKAKESA